MAALAMCRQLQLTSVSISWTVASAMCAASRSASAGGQHAGTENVFGERIGLVGEVEQFDLRHQFEHFTYH
jgi:hypothetical protein